MVRLTDPAVEDLTGLMRKDPRIARWALKKVLQLEADPEAGQPLLGELIGWRKITVGNRDWRIIWRVTNDQAGDVIIDVAEVWAAGARSDGEVYAEMNDRVRSLPESPRTTALADLVSKLGKVASGLNPAPEPASDADHQLVPSWLRSRLIDQVMLPATMVDAFNLEEAVDQWNRVEFTAALALFALPYLRQALLSNLTDDGSDACREDKTAAEADTIGTVREYLG